MCLLAIAFQQHRNAPLVVISNRDEYYARPTKPMHWWNEAQILAGRDIQAGGTWMGLSRKGRFAAVTNYRYIPGNGQVENKPLSRGHLVTGFLNSAQSAGSWAISLQQTITDYGGFNLLIYDGEELVYLNNYNQEKPETLLPGVYALSNNLLDSPWPKVDYVRQKLQHTVETAGDFGSAQIPRLMDDLSLQKTYAPHLLPQTGVSPEWEEILSSPFIVADGYGTRASTVMIISASGEVNVAERSFKAGRVIGEVEFSFGILGS